MGKLYILFITIFIGFTLGTTDVTIEQESCLSKSANETESSSTVKSDNVTAEDIVPSTFATATYEENKSNETDKDLVNDTRFQQPSIFEMLSRLNKPADMKNDLTLNPFLTVTNINNKNINETENKEKYDNPLVDQHKGPILGITSRFAENNNKINVDENIDQNNLLNDNIKNYLLNIMKSAREGNNQNKGQVKKAIVEMMDQLKNITQSNEENIGKSEETTEPIVKFSKQVANTTEINTKSRISSGILSMLHPVDIIHSVVDETGLPTPCTCGVFLSGQFKKNSKEQPKGEPLILQEMDTPFLNNVMGKRQCTNKCLEMIIKHIPKSSDIICATADRDIYKEKAYLFIKNFSNKWLPTNLSAGREFCCKDNTSYKCPLA